MISEQTSGHLRQLLAGLGVLATAFGWLTAEQVAAGVKLIQDIAGPVVQIVGPLGVVGGYAWSWWVNRPKALVASVVAMADDPASPVKGVVMARTIEGRALANEFDTNKIAEAGSSDAKAIASQ